MMHLGRRKDSVGDIGGGSPPDSAAVPVSHHAEAADHGPLKAYRDALDKVAIVAMTDMRGRITEVNSLFCAISGYERSELIGFTHSLLNSGHHPRSFFDDLWKTISTGRVWRGDICNRAKNGALYWVDTTIAPLRDPIGRLEGYVSIRFDISERKAAEERAELERLRRQDSETLLTGLLEAMPNNAMAPRAENSDSALPNPSGRQ